MFTAAVSGWRTRSCGISAAIALSGALGACGSQPRQDAQEPSGTFPVSVSAASFPASQTLAQHTHMVIAVRNSGHKTIPNIAVTITDPQYGTSIRAFSSFLHMQGVASHSRPVWIVDRSPGTCGYSCVNGGAGGAATAYANTWALGRLGPGQTAKFVWGLTAVAAGTYHIHYVIAAGLNGKAKARLAGGGIAEGSFTATISRAPAQAYVNNSGQIVQSK